MSNSIVPIWNRSNNPFVYTDPWTGTSFNVFPSAHPDTYPIGFFGDVDAARDDYRSPDERIALLQFWSSQWNNTLQRLNRSPYSQHEISQLEEQIALWQSEIVTLQDASFRATRHQFLINHMSTYLDRLTPRDRQWAEDRMAEWKGNVTKDVAAVQMRLIG